MIDTPPLLPQVHAAPSIDMVAALVLSGMVRFDEVMDGARRLGADLFPVGPYRTIASQLVTGIPCDELRMTRAERTGISMVLDFLENTDIPHTAEWGLRVLKVQAERNFAGLVADSLEWAASQIRTGTDPSRLRTFADNAFAVAAGARPLDLHDPWSTT